LAYADVSISFAGATDIARETADVVLMEDDLRGLIMAVKCARQAMDIITQNTLIVAVPNLGALISGIFFALDPILAVVINNGTAILAELNGLRPLIGPGDAPTLGHTLSPAEIAEEDKRLQEDHASTHNSHHAAPVGNAIDVEVVLVPESPADSTTSNGAVTSVAAEPNHHGFGLEAALEAELSVQPQNNLVPLKQGDLAKRLGLPTQALTHHRVKPEFIEWSMMKDPEGIAWIYEPLSKFFCPTAPLGEESQAPAVGQNSHPKTLAAVNK
jgi:hypothetical protein